MSDMITAEEVRKLLDGTTPGPWFVQDFTAPEVNDDPTAGDVYVSCTWPDHICVASMGGGFMGYKALDQARADAAAIARWPDLARTVIALHAQLADAKAAQAMVVERAVKAVKSLWKWDDEGWQVERPSQPQAEAAIRALADADGLAAVDALRKERDLAVAQNDRLWAANHKLVAAQDAAEADRDRLAAANAALEAQVQALEWFSEVTAEAAQAAYARVAALAEVQADARREGGE